MISFENVDLIFGQKPARAQTLLDAGKSRAEINTATGAVVGVHGASFAVAPGELLVIMGLSGSGKSSLLRCINGLNGRGGATGTLRGKVLVSAAGRPLDVSRCDRSLLRELRMRHVSMVFQQFGLMPWRTVEDNVALPLELAGVPPADRKRRVRERLALVGLEQWLGRHPHELSGGMQQRVGLARAFVTDSPVLLMDEPFSALDPLIRRQLQEELLSLRDRLGKTIVFVSHDIEEALRLGNRIAVMQEGRLLQIGTPRQIITAPACDAVRRFVESANPLDALTADALMTELPPGSSPDDGVVAPASLPLRQAAALLCKQSRPLLLAGEGGRLVGMLTEREIMRSLVAKELQPS